jgi:hypothetical protein
MADAERRNARMAKDRAFMGDALLNLPKGFCYRPDSCHHETDNSSPGTLGPGIAWCGGECESR